MSANAPLLLRAARGEQVERPPVWMMRQAGRYMKVYRDLRDRHPGFRERSENPDLSYEISMQPFHAFKPDGVILFSDILTPLPGMGIDFDIVESKGPLIQDPIRTMAQVEALRPLQPAESMPFVGEVLTRLRSAVGNEAAVLGFVGAPWTLAAYVVEGKSSKNYAVIKAMAFQEPQLLHRLLDHFAESIAAYLRYQIDSGAQVVQMFDSWAGQLSPMDYDTFAAPYQKKVVDLVKQTHPDTPFILYISGSAWPARGWISCPWTGPWTWPKAWPACPSTWVCRAMWTPVCCSAPRKPSVPASTTRCARPAAASTSSTWATASCLAPQRKTAPPSLKLASR
jgi:uroporphyrinogen decarboxylase